LNPRHLFVDSRMTGLCAYCGGDPETRDHVPSKILLDDPLPVDLPTVDACAKCNGSFSLDEEYVACFLDCVISGTCKPESVSRQKVSRALSRNPQLMARMADSCRINEEGIQTWVPDDSRLRNIVLKLARGHVNYELSLTLVEEPNLVYAEPFILMSEFDVSKFEQGNMIDSRLFPEVGSRSFLRKLGSRPYDRNPGPWIVVQEGRYRYSVEQTDGVIVRIVLSEYLACLVKWQFDRNED